MGLKANKFSRSEKVMAKIGYRWKEVLFVLNRRSEHF